MTNERLREAARRAIRSGAVPGHRAERIWGGLGTGARCAVCKVKVPQDDIELEVEFIVDEGRSRSLHMHQRCYASWEAERCAMETLEAKRERG